MRAGVQIVEQQAGDIVELSVKTVGAYEGGLKNSFRAF